MNTTPKPIDLIHKHLFSILALVMGLALGYGFGASRAQYAVVYAPAAGAPGFAPQPARPVSAAVAAAQAAPEAAPRLASAVAFPTAAARPAALAAAEASPSRVAAARPPALQSRSQNFDLAAHEKSSAFLQKAKDVAEARQQAPAAASLQPVERAESAAPRVIAQGGTIHYGAATRSEIMGRSAGPVYNFKGAGADPQDNNAAVQGQTIGATLQNATETIDATNKTLEASGLSPEMRQQIRTQLDASKAGIQQVQGGGQ